MIQRRDPSGRAANPELNQPGLRKLREAVANQPAEERRSHVALRRDALAGLSTTIANVPDGMATAILAGVNPIHGLYASMVGPIVGGFLSSARLMVITTTAAGALAAGQAADRLPTETRESALFLMVLLVGIFQMLCGALGLGRLTRFVSYSVTTGFLMGIGVLIVLSQLPTVAGYAPAARTTIAQTFELFVNLDQIHWPSAGVSVLTLGIALTLSRTRLGTFGILAAIVIPSAVVALAGMNSVQIVRDIGEIPRGIPKFVLPSFRETLDVLTGALAVGAIIMVQGAGVSQTVPNPDGSRSSPSRDFIAQGAANIASALFRGLPVGGSLGTTALNVVSGAASKWASILGGLWMIAIVLIVPGLVALVAMPPLGVLLLIAGIRTIELPEVRSIWQTGWASRFTITATFLSTLFLPIQLAVGIGVLLSAIIHLSASSADISVVELVRRPDGRLEERRPPKELAANKVTVLDVYGHLFYAGARTLERLLPTPVLSGNTAVILRLRGRTTVGATLIEVLHDYAESLRQVNGRLYLTGLSQELYAQIVRTGKLLLTGPVRAYEATPIIGESTEDAREDAQSWLVQCNGDPTPDRTSFGEAA